jgi:prephenate dehydrogenase
VSAAPASPFARVCIVGCGLMGGSLALAAREVPGVEEVVVTDADPAVLHRAAERGIGDRHEAEASTAARGADLVVLATPVAATARIYQSLADVIGQRTVVTDVSSVKAQVLREIEGYGEVADHAPNGRSRFIGGHPMAGSERSGIEAADGKLFQGATWLLTPTEHSDEAAFERLSGFLRQLGARVLAVEPELHDRLVAIASHLPQVLASTLMDEAADAAERTGEAVLAVAAGGFRDATRVAGSDPDLWVGILRENRPAVLEAIDGFLERLTTVRAAIQAGDWPEVRQRLARARAARERLPSKDRVGRLIDLVIPVADRPGVLAEVTTALGEAGVNIEDLSMRHASAGDRGALLVAVDGDAAAHRALGILERRSVIAHLEPR